MKLVFDDQALADLENIYDWIAQESSATAKTRVQKRAIRLDPRA
jgi:plasmid stabilization system protein ParE